MFVDGMATSEPMLPFRYYGVSRWDALPVDTQANGRPSWALQPGSGAIELPPPASPWLFPLDLPLELARRIVFGREDVTATIVLPPTPADQRIDAEVAPTGQSGLVDRAQKARTSR